MDEEAEQALNRMLHNLKWIAKSFQINAEQMHLLVNRGRSKERHEEWLRTLHIEAQGLERLTRRILETQQNGAVLETRGVIVKPHGKDVEAE